MPVARCYIGSRDQVEFDQKREYSSGQSKVYVAFAFNDRSTIKSFRVKRKRNITKTLTPKQNSVETESNRERNGSDGGAETSNKRAVSYNSLDTHEKPLLHDDIESSVCFPVLSLR